MMAFIYSLFSPSVLQWVKAQMFTLFQLKARSWQFLRSMQCLVNTTYCEFTIDCWQRPMTDKYYWLLVFKTMSTSLIDIIVTTLVCMITYTLMCHCIIIIQSMFKIETLVTTIFFVLVWIEWERITDFTVLCAASVSNTGTFF